MWFCHGCAEGAVPLFVRHGGSGLSSNPGLAPVEGDIVAEALRLSGSVEVAVLYSFKGAERQASCKRRASTIDNFLDVDPDLSR